jgi:hypothetical protein
MPRKFKIGEFTGEVPDEKIGAFLAKYPNAIEIGQEKGFFDRVKDVYTNMPLMGQSVLPKMKYGSFIESIGQAFGEETAERIVPEKLNIVRGGRPTKGASNIAKMILAMGLNPVNYIPLGLPGKAVKPLAKIVAYRVAAKVKDPVTGIKQLRVGKPGQVHGQLFEPKENLTGRVDMGFLDEHGKYITREEAVARRGEDAFYSNPPDLMKVDDIPAKPLEKIVKGAEGKLDPKLVGRSKVLENKVPKASVMKHQPEVGKIRGPALDIEQARITAETLEPTMAKPIIEKLEAGKQLSPMEILTMGVHGKKNAPQIVADAAEGNLNKVLATYLKAVKQPGQALRTVRDANDLFIKGLYDDIAKLSPTDQKNAKKILESFGIAEKGAFNPKAVDKFVEWATMIKLTGISTHLKNVLGNSAELLLRVPEKAGAGAIDAFVGTISGKGRSVYATEALAEFVGAWKSIKNATHGFWGMMVHPTKYLEEATKAGEVTFRRGAISGLKGEIIRLPGRLLGGMDVFFKELNKGSEIYALALRMAKKEGKRGAELIKRTQHFIENPTNQMKAMSRESAKVRVFQKDLGSIASKLDQIRTKHSLMRLVVPFWKTPVNLLKRGIERTPIPGLAYPFAKKMWKGLDRAGKMELLGRMTVGSALLIGTTMYALEGGISSGGPKSSAKRDLLRLGGWQPYSIRVGNTWVSYRGFEPMSSWFRTTGDVAEARISESEYVEWAGKFAGSYMQQFIENPFLMGIKDVLNAFDSPDSFAPRLVANLAVGSTIPVLLQQWGTRVFDPTVRKPIKKKGQKFPADIFGMVGEEVKSRTPGLSKQVSPMRNIFGEPIVRESPVSQAFGFTLSTDKNKKLESELSRLAGLEKGLSIGKPSRNILGYELDTEEYERLVILTGSMFKKSVSQFIHSPDYGKYDDKFKIKVIKELKSDINRLIREQDFGKYYRK